MRLDLTGLEISCNQLVLVNYIVITFQAIFLTISYSEHNRVARELKIRLDAEQFFQAFSSAAQDDILYQEARRIVIAEVLLLFFDKFDKFFIQFQNIAYKEYLPMIIGPKMMQEKNLEIGKSPTKYDPDRDPRVSNEFATVIRW